MAKKYILRKFRPGSKEHNKVNTLVSLNTLGLSSNNALLKNSLASGASESNLSNTSLLYPYNNDAEANDFAKYRDITKSADENYAYFELSYAQRVEYLRMFAQQQTISFVLDTVADDVIVFDENNYFAKLDIKQLKANVSAGSKKGDELVETCEKAFKRVYSMFGWDKNAGAWNFLRKLLIEGYLSFEIIFNDLENPTEIIGFKYIDPQTLEPAIEIDSKGREVKVWYQNRDSAEERCIPDINIIYISWSSAYSGEITRLSYLEGLTRSYNMLSQMENSRLIWNIQNSQKKMKIIVPVGDLSPAKSETLINQIKADWTEETHVDTMSGEVVINGTPQFSFTKTYFFPQRSSGSMTIEEIAPEGYDMSSIDPLKYFWKRFIIETKVPANRFPLDLGGDGGGSLIKDDSAITREEYTYGRFINRIRTIFREVLLKPIWIQVCLYLPELAPSEFLKQAIGIVFNEENIFTEAKERNSLKAGVDIINQLAGLRDSNDKPVFSIQFLVEKFLNFTQEDKELNERYKQQEILDALDKAKDIKDHQQYNQEHASSGGIVPGTDGGGDGGGFGDFGMDNAGDFGGGADFAGSGEFGGGEDADFGGGAYFGGGDLCGGIL